MAALASVYVQLQNHINSAYGPFLYYILIHYLSDFTI
jgi:hypothetical protein